MIDRTAWAEVNLAALASNVRGIKSLLQPKTRLCAVVKANAYGHGSVAVAQTVLQAGADQLAVAIMDEALVLRQAGFTVPILVLGHLSAEYAHLAVKFDVSQTVYALDAAVALSKAAVEIGKPAKVHLKIDTGMGRIGVRPEEISAFFSAVKKLPGIEIEGMFSHFSTADCEDKTYAYQQLDQFKAAMRYVRQSGARLPLCHIANSAAAADLPEAHLDMVRAGIIMYGYWPGAKGKRAITLKPALKLKAKIVHLKDIAAGDSIGYGNTFTAERACRIATLPLGYADGLDRLLSNRWHVLVRQVQAPIVGRICMDQCMIDVSGVPDVQLGDEALILGGAGCSVEDAATMTGTISYEVLCKISGRVPRVYRSFQ